jgi:cell division initiation protein
MAKITVVDIQHKTFKKALQGYERTEVDQFLDEIIETLEDEAQARAALEADVADLKERISHFKAMEESLQHTLLLAQRTADEVKAAAHREADLIRQEARLAAEREIAALSDRIDESRREAQRARDTAEKAKSELRSLLMSHLALIDRGPLSVTPPAPSPVVAEPVVVAPVPAPPPPAAIDARPTIKSETDEFAQLP